MRVINPKGDKMAISKDKEQIVAVIPKEHKKTLERIAEEEGRSLSAQVAYIIKQYIQNLK